MILESDKSYDNTIFALSLTLSLQLIDEKLNDLFSFRWNRLPIISFAVHVFIINNYFLFNSYSDSCYTNSNRILSLLGFFLRGI